MSDLKRKREEGVEEEEDALGGLMGTYASSDESEGGLKLGEHADAAEYLQEVTCYFSGEEESPHGPSPQTIASNAASWGSDDANKETPYNHEQESEKIQDIVADNEDDREQHSWRMALPSELRLPPPGEPSEEITKKVEKMLALKAAGRSFNESLKKHKGYRNPDLLYKLVSNFGVEQHGSAFDPRTFNPSLRRDDHLASLLEQNERDLEKKAKERSQLYSTPEGLMSLKTDKAIEFLGRGSGQGGGGGNAGTAALLAAQQVLNASRNVASSQPSRRDRR